MGKEAFVESTIIATPCPNDHFAIKTQKAAVTAKCKGAAAHVGDNPRVMLLDYS